ncbi:MAG: DNA-3-methyladenine glycosylase 2 family protein [Chloroflexi bacterium]|nr:DNA-3-methyladenine glycosylase 2 family protein [Chloroflexota bacterium]OJV95234.1 MAG: 3-methyladenine DNA glycosylase [Chloroflexi bacterium 54-19]
MVVTFTAETLPALCDKLAENDPDLASVLERYGYPPFWARANNYETLVHIILEQQVSLASAQATLNKLREKVGAIIPENVILLTDEEFRACYFSRQKTAYVRTLTEKVLAGELNFLDLAAWTDEAIRQKLVALKGIGNWTVDVYLILVLHRADVFPVGDLAALNGLKELKGLPKETPREALLEIAEGWRPYRTIATNIIWHNYLSLRGRK